MIYDLLRLKAWLYGVNSFFIWGGFSKIWGTLQKVVTQRSVKPIRVLEENWRWHLFHGRRREFWFIKRKLNMDEFPDQY